VAESFHCGTPGPVWSDRDSHSPWTDFQGPRRNHNHFKHY
jgi:hypothetical protein